MKEIDDFIHSRAFFEGMLAWRWDKLCDSYEEGKPLPGELPVTDPRIREGLHFCKELDCRDWPPPRTADETIFNSDLGKAWMLWQDPARRRLRWLLEACIYGKMSGPEIARRLKLDPAAVAMYEFWFFAIRPMMNDPNFIQGCDSMLGRSIDGTDESALEDVQWKRLAWAYGAEALLDEVSDSAGDGPGD